MEENLQLIEYAEKGQLLPELSYGWIGICLLNKAGKHALAAGLLEKFRQEYKNTLGVEYAVDYTNLV